MDTLTEEENLIVTVALATCFGYRFPSGSVSLEDLESYVNQIIAIYKVKPFASIDSENAKNMKQAIMFCVEQLRKVAPSQATKLSTAFNSLN